MRARTNGADREPDERTRAIVRRRAAAVGAIALGCAAIGLSVALSTRGRTVRASASTRGGAAVRGHGSGPSSSSSAPSAFAVGLRVLRFVDQSRQIELPDGRRQPRALVTYVRYPAVGPATGTDLSNAAAARADGPFPLVIFGHGFALTPKPYARMLQSWARAGYVVAAPVFPRENANAPGGPDESDLINQPADMSLVISRLLALSAGGTGPLAGIIDPKKIAVTGHSDGGDTALAVAYDGSYRDARVGAAVILSGAEIPEAGSIAFPPAGPPLLAVQGTADTVNPPGATNAFFITARRPKYLLTLIGAEHLPPYSEQQPQLSIVERVTTAFLDAYLKHEPNALAQLGRIGNARGTASLLAEP